MLTTCTGKYYFSKLCSKLISLLIQIKKRTGTPLKTGVIKQIRLFLLWIYYFGVVVALLNYTIDEEVNSESDEEFFEGFIEYIDCVYGDPDDTDCRLKDFIRYPSYGTIYSIVFTQFGLPIVVFLVFGARKSMLSFWKEYILYMWKNKTITFQFNPSFDSTTISRSSIKKVVDSKTDIDNEDSRFERLKKLKKRIKEI